ncbi:hypothetical protein CHELA17_64747 [Chelatococcus asaccharovorans]|nr:hypothetical protein CHELA17_64747 [Chelatococcus asaccharovorans]
MLLPFAGAGHSRGPSHVEQASHVEGASHFEVANHSAGANLVPAGRAGGVPAGGEKRRSLSALLTTLTLDKAIARPASMGDSNIPKAG